MGVEVLTASATTTSLGCTKSQVLLVAVGGEVGSIHGDVSELEMYNVL